MLAGISTEKNRTLAPFRSDIDLGYLIYIQTSADSVEPELRYIRWTES